MTREDINDIIKAVCPNDEDYEKSCISPKYLKQELEQLALEQEPTTKNDCAEQNGCITCSLDDGDDCCRKLYEESMQEPTPKKDLAVVSECKLEDCISRKQAQDEIYRKCQRWSLSKANYSCGQDVWNDYMISSKDAMQVLRELPSVYPKSDNEVVALEFLEDIDKPSKYQTSDGTWHTGMISCDDAISRLAVRKAINRYIEKAQSSGVVDAFISFEELVIKALPTVYPKKETVTEFADRCRECGKMRTVYSKSDKSVLEDIQQIVDDWNDDENAMILANKIKEVIEDGSNT